MAEPLPTLDPDVGASGDGASGDGGFDPAEHDPAEHDPAEHDPAEHDRQRAPADPDTRVQDQLWWAAGAVWRRRWWIVAVTVLVAGLAVWLTVQIPNRYRAEARVMLPDSGVSGLGAILGRSSSAAAALLGGGGGGYTRYLALLTSRTTLEDVVERYELVRRYEAEGEPDPVAAAVGTLASRADFDVSLEYNYLAVRVLDEDPALAAQMANTFIEILNRENTALNQESASTYRVYLERRLRKAETDMDSLMGSMQGIQERYGVFEPQAQGAAVMDALASAGALVAEAEVGYEMLRSEFGDENDQTRTAAAGLAAARAQRDRLTAGGDAVMPVELSRIPEVGRRYAQVQQGILLQGEILKELQPLYEQSLLNERRQSDAVQVIDPAVPPARKAEPRRSVMVVAATASAFLVALAVALLLAVWRAHAPAVLARLRAETGAR